MQNSIFISWTHKPLTRKKMDCNLEDVCLIFLTELQFKHSQPGRSALRWSLGDATWAVVMVTRATKCAYLSQWHDQPSGAALASYCSSCSLASRNLWRKWSVLKPPHFQSWVRVCNKVKFNEFLYKRETDLQLKLLARNYILVTQLVLQSC